MLRKRKRSDEEGEMSRRERGWERQETGRVKEKQGLQSKGYVKQHW